MCCGANDSLFTNEIHFFRSKYSVTRLEVSDFGCMTKTYVPYPTECNGNFLTCRKSFLVSKPLTVHLCLLWLSMHLQATTNNEMKRTNKKKAEKEEENQVNIPCVFCVPFSQHGTRASILKCNFHARHDMHLISHFINRKCIQNIIIK